MNVRGSTLSTSAGGTAISITPVAGTVPGDAVIVVLNWNDGASETASDNNGSTPFDVHINNFRNNGSAGHAASVFSRRIQPGDPATYQFQLSAAQRWTAVAITIQNPHPTTIFDVVPASANCIAGTSANPVSVPSVSTSTPDALHFSVLCTDGINNATASTPSGYTILQNGGQKLVAVAVKSFPATGAVGITSYSDSLGVTKTGISFAVQSDGKIGSATGAATVAAVGASKFTAVASASGSSSVIGHSSGWGHDILQGIVSDSDEPNGWNALLSTIPDSAVVRTSDTVVTITLPELATYDISSTETLTVTVPASMLTGAAPIVASPTITITAGDNSAAAAGAASVHGVGAATTSAVGSVSGSATVSGSAGGWGHDILTGLVSAQGEASGWNNLLINIPDSAIVRTSDTVVTITLPPLAGYNISTNESITSTIPDSILTGTAPIVATPTMVITPSEQGAAAGAATVLGVGAALNTAVASASGLAAVNGISGSEFIAVATGSATVLGVGASTVRSVGVVAGVAQALAQEAFQTSVASTAGSATVLGVGSAATVAVGSASGNASVVGQTGALKIGSAAGNATVIGVGRATILGVGVSEGAAQPLATAHVGNFAQSIGGSSVLGVGRSTVVAVGSASGNAAVSGIRDGTLIGEGSASGAATVLGVGRSTTTAIGSASGNAVVSGISPSLSSFAAEITSQSTATLSLDKNNFALFLLA